MRASIAMLVLLILLLFAAYVSAADTISYANISTDITVNTTKLPLIFENYSTMFTGAIDVKEKCKPPLLRASGYLAFLVRAFAVDGQPINMDEANELSREIAGIIAEQINNKIVTGWFVLSSMYVPRGEVDAALQFLQLYSTTAVIAAYGVEPAFVSYNGSLADILFIYPVMAPLSCKVFDAKTVSFGYGGWYMVVSKIECSGVIPPGKYIGTPILYFDPHDLGILCTYDYVGNCVTKLADVDVLLSAFDLVAPITSPEDLSDTYVSQMVTGIVAVWVEFGDTASQTFAAPASIVLPLVAQLMVYGSGEGSISPYPSPGPIAMAAPPITQLQSGEMGVMFAQGVTFQPVTIVVPSLTCATSLSYDIGTGVVTPGPGGPLVVPGASLGNYSLGRVEVPKLKPSDVLAVPDLDTPAGVVTAIGLFALWMALASIMGLATGTMVAMILYAVYGWLAGSGVLVVGGAIGFVLALLYRYLTGSA